MPSYLSAKRLSAVRYRVVPSEPLLLDIYIVRLIDRGLVFQEKEKKEEKRKNSIYALVYSITTVGDVSASFHAR